MLSADLKPVTRKWAIALIIISLLQVGVPFITWFQTRAQLISPFIPQNVVFLIVEPYMISGIISTVVTLVAFIFFVYSRFVFCIITCAAGCIIPQLYFLLFYH